MIKIRAFINGWNDRCQPFVWTKTPDGILKKANRKELQMRSIRCWNADHVVIPERCLMFLARRCAGPELRSRPMHAILAPRLAQNAIVAHPFVTGIVGSCHDLFASDMVMIRPLLHFATASDGREARICCTPKKGARCHRRTFETANSARKWTY
jgi:hypothetical protein